MRYKRIQIEVDACQCYDDIKPEWYDMMKSASLIKDCEYGGVYVLNSEKRTYALPTDYIVKYEGKIYIVPKEFFEENYEVIR